MRSIAFVGIRGTNRGEVKVYVDNVLVTTIDMNAAATSARFAPWQRTYASPGTHTLKLVVVGTAGRPRIDLDAVLALY